MKKILLFIFIFVLFALHVAHSASAHVLQTNGTIGAVMHIDPDDDPIAQIQASFFFDFKDTTAKFDPKACNCTIAIVENGHTIYAQSLFQNTSNPSLSNASLFYTFPTPGVYQVRAHGSPRQSGAFQSFTLTYNVRVEQPETSSQAISTNNFFFNHIGHFIIGIVILLLVIFVAIRNYRDHGNIFSKRKI